MSEFRFSKRSYKAMKGVRPELIAVAARALWLSPIDFGVTEGLRSTKRQRQLVATGASRTMRSRHLTGHALDVVAYVNGKVRWDWPLYEQISKAFKLAADQLGVDLEWGGDWQAFKDGPHYQLSWQKYPK